MHPDTGFDDVFEMVAAEEGVSVEAVRAEIARAMQDAMNSSDPAVQAHWRSMKKAGETPTRKKCSATCSGLWRMHKKKGAPCEAPFVCGLKAYLTSTVAPTSLKVATIFSHSSLIFRLKASSA